jgi:hypothetical protein
MKHPAFDTIPRTFLFVGLFILAGALIPLCLAGLIALNTGILMLQGAISGLLICGISILLWFITRFTKLSGSSLTQTILNHLALLAFTLLAWLGVEYLLFYLLFPEDIFQLLTSILPFKVVIGLLVFVSVIQFYGKLPVTEPDEEETELIQESIASETTSKSTNRHPMEKLTVKSGSNIHIIPVSDLLYLQAEGDYVILYMAGARFIKEETMKNLETQLPSHFIRIHRSCIVNANCISRIELYEKQHYQITLKTGQKLKASTSGYKLLKDTLHL